MSGPLTVASASRYSEHPMPWDYANYLEPIHQETALKYVFAYLRNNPCDYRAVLSDDVTARISINGDLVMAGRKEDLIKFMSEHYFSQVRKVQMIGLKISGGEEPCIKLETLQFQDDQKGQFTHDIRIKVAKEGDSGVFRVRHVVHSWFPTILPPTHPMMFQVAPDYV